MVCRKRETKRSEMAPGVSVVLCCYNSAHRLPRALAHLAVQRVPKTLHWEVIIVDNASDDKTRDVALEAWNRVGAVPLRVVMESRSGQAFARNRGLAEAKYDIVSFVDDDNWVCPEWVELVWDVMKSHPDVGACGGGGHSWRPGQTPDVPRRSDQPR